MTRRVMAVSGETNGLDYMGHVSWYSRGEASICAEELRELANKHGLPEDFLPAAIRGVDAFKRATSEIQTFKRRTNEDTQEPCIMVRTVEMNRDEVIKHMVIEEIVENGGKELEYTHVANFHYDRENNRFTYLEKIPGFTHKIEEAKHLFEEYSQFYQADSIQRMVVDAYSRLNGISVRRSGGVVFIPKTNDTLLESLVNVIGSLKGWEIHRIPLVDADEQRNMISAKIQEHIIAESQEIAKFLGAKPEVANAKKNLQELVADMVTTLESGVVTKGKAAAALTQFEHLGDTILEYQQLLKTNMDEVHHYIDLAEQQLDEMIKKAAKEGKAS